MRKVIGKVLLRFGWVKRLVHLSALRDEILANQSRMRIFNRANHGRGLVKTRRETEALVKLYNSTRFFWMEPMEVK